jgi:hypothetical protein
VKAAYVISGLVFQMEFDTNVEGSQVQVMVISIISLMRKKMVYSWMKCLKCFIPQIWRHLLDIGWIGLRYLGIQHPTLGSFNIFLTKNWVPKSILTGSPYSLPFLGKGELWYVISVELSMLFQPTFLLLIDWKTK